MSFLFGLLGVKQNQNQNLPIMVHRNLSLQDNRIKKMTTVEKKFISSLEYSNIFDYGIQEM